MATRIAGKVNAHDATHRYRPDSTFTTQGRGVPLTHNSYIAHIGIGKA